MVSIECMENSSANSSASVLVLMSSAIVLTTVAAQGLLSCSSASSSILSVMLVDQLSMFAAGSRVKANSLNLTKWFTHVQSGSMLSVITNRYFYEKA